MGRPRVAAHRGGARLWPENSLEAFRHALGLGVDFVEFDVHLTADGAVAVIHDATLERTTDGAGLVATAKAADLRRRRLRGPDGGLTGERVPTLEEVLAVVAPVPVALLVEVKGPAPGVAVRYERADGRVRAVGTGRYDGLEERVLAALGAVGLTARATLMAFNPEVLARVHALAPGVRTTLLVAAAHVAAVGARAEEAIDWAVAAGATDAGLQYPLVTAPVVRAARAAGLVLGAWTVNDEEEMQRLADLGIDVITSDRPDIARRLFGEPA